MAIAISDSNLKEIYSLSYEDKLDLVDLIIKSIRSATNTLKVKATESPISWVSQFEGKWIDQKSADEMVNEIKQHRTSNSEVVL